MTGMATSLGPCAKLPMKNYLTKSERIVVMFCTAFFRKVELSVITCGPAIMMGTITSKVVTTTGPLLHKICSYNYF